ncbi:MAG: hypothetical protein M3552_09380 [Planctomycetota bacterium]|nr:hypothetical protein [Planctomycetota bacterium]
MVDAALGARAEVATGDAAGAPPAFWLRVTLVSAVLFVAIVGAAKWGFPLLQLGFLWKAAAVIPGMFGYLAIMVGLHMLLPKFVEVRKDRISINHGQTTTRIRAKDVEATRLVFFGDDRALLRISYRQRGQRRFRTVGVKPTVDLAKLAQMPPVPPRVSDLRDNGLRL